MNIRYVAERELDISLQISVQKAGKVQSVRATSARMRQNMSEENGFEQKQLFRNSQAYKADDDDSVFSISQHFERSFSVSSAQDISDYNNITMNVLGIKTMLLQMKIILEKVY